MVRNKTININACGLFIFLFVNFVHITEECRFRKIYSKIEELTSEEMNKAHVLLSDQNCRIVSEISG